MKYDGHIICCFVCVFFWMSKVLKTALHYDFMIYLSKEITIKEISNKKKKKGSIWGEHHCQTVPYELGNLSQNKEKQAAFGESTTTELCHTNCLAHH